MTVKKLKKFNPKQVFNNVNSIANPLQYSYFCKRNLGKMKKLAIPIKNNKLSEYFGQCSHYEIYEIDNKTIRKSGTAHPPVKEPDKIPEWVESKGITDVVTYKIDKELILKFSETKINLFMGIAVDAPEIIIQNYMDGSLKSDLKIINELTNS